MNAVQVTNCHYLGLHQAHESHVHQPARAIAGYIATLMRSPEPCGNCGTPNCGVSVREGLDTALQSWEATYLHSSKPVITTMVHRNDVRLTNREAIITMLQKPNPKWTEQSNREMIATKVLENLTVTSEFLRFN